MCSSSVCHVGGETDLCKREREWLIPSASRNLCTLGTLDCDELVDIVDAAGNIKVALGSIIGGVGDVEFRIGIVYTVDECLMSGVSRMV